MILFTPSCKKQFASLINAMIDNHDNNDIIQKMNVLYKINPDLLLEKVKRDLTNCSMRINMGGIFNNLVYIDVLSTILHCSNDTILNHFLELNKKANLEKKLETQIDLYANKFLSIFFQRNKKENLEPLFNLLTQELVDINWLEKSKEDPIYNYTSVLHKAINASIHTNPKNITLFINPLTTNEPFSLDEDYFKVLKQVIKHNAIQQDNNGELIIMVLESGLKVLLDEVLTISNIDNNYIKKSLHKVNVLISDEKKEKYNFFNKLNFSQDLIRNLEIHVEKDHLNTFISPNDDTIKPISSNTNTKRKI